jgi:hypothetical protein
LYPWVPLVSALMCLGPDVVLFFMVVFCACIVVLLTDLVRHQDTGVLDFHDTGTFDMCSWVSTIEFFEGCFWVLFVGYICNRWVLGVCVCV